MRVEITGQPEGSLGDEVIVVMMCKTRAEAYDVTFNDKQSSQNIELQVGKIILLNVITTPSLLLQCHRHAAADVVDSCQTLGGQRTP